MKIKVLHVIDSMGYGGAESALQILAPALEKEGIDISVAVLGPPHAGLAGFNNTVDLHLLEVGRTWSIFNGGAQIGRLLRQKRFDVVHSNLFFSELHVAASRMVTRNVLRAVTFHNLVYLSHPPVTIAKKARRRLHGIMARSSFQLPFAVSRAVADHHEWHLGLKGIEVVPNPIDLDLVEKIRRGDGPEPPAWWEEVKDRLNIVVVGRLSPEKGQKYAIEAVSNLRDDGVDANLFLIGGGPDLQRLKDQVSESRLEDRVFFPGQLPRDVLFDVVKESTVLLCPSLQEGFGLAAAEAMALECPVVGTRCGGLEEVVEDGRTGLLVAPRDSEAMARAIRRLIDDKNLCRSLTTKGREVSTSRFSSRSVAVSLVSAYEKGLDDPLPSGAS